MICSYRNYRHLQEEKFITSSPVELDLVKTTGPEVTGAAAAGAGDGDAEKAPMMAWQSSAEGS